MIEGGKGARTIDMLVVVAVLVECMVMFVATTRHFRHRDSRPNASNLISGVVQFFSHTVP